MLDREISKYVDILQRVARGCTLSPNLFKVNINDIMVVAKQQSKESRYREDTAVSGLMFADDFVGISEMPEELQKQIESKH